MKKLFLYLIALFAITSCGGGEDFPPINPQNPTVEPNDPEPEPDEPTSNEEFTLIKGADVSWLTQMEAEGIGFYHSDGQKADCMEILQSLGMNTFRFRVWVNPADGWCNKEDLINKAVRASKLGIDVMVDFHYSDSWADPSKQNIPASWKDMNLDELCVAVSEHTKDVLNDLKNAGVTPKWVQVGNETGNGMLWPYGQADKNPSGYAKLNNAGYDAVKEVFPEAKVIVHVQNGNNNNLFRWLFDILKNNDGKWDVIGMSLYPEQNDYKSMVSDCKLNIEDLIARYNKDVILCEVGMGNSYVSEMKDFLNRCFNLSTQISDNRFLGVVYWEPQVYNDWNGYRKGAFTSEGRPSEALDVYKQW